MDILHWPAPTRCCSAVDGPIWLPYGACGDTLFDLPARLLASVRDPIAAEGLPTDLREKAILQDWYITGLARLDELAPVLNRVTFYATSNSVSDGRQENVVQARFIMTAYNLSAMALAILRAQSTSCQDDIRPVRVVGGIQ
jgi:hypothetical protein